MSFDVSAAFRDCLINLDVKGIRDLHARFHPHAPQPKDDDEALMLLHMVRARPDSDFLPEQGRQYSKDWLAEDRLIRTANSRDLTLEERLELASIRKAQRYREFDKMQAEKE
jgi:hypothetical protein